MISVFTSFLEQFTAGGRLVFIPDSAVAAASS